MWKWWSLSGGSAWGSWSRSHSPEPCQPPVSFGGRREANAPAASRPRQHRHTHTFISCEISKFSKNFKIQKFSVTSLDHQLRASTTAMQLSLRYVYILNTQILLKRGISHLEILAASFSEDTHQPTVMVDFHLFSHSEILWILIPATFLSLNHWKIQFMRSFIHGTIVEVDCHLKAQHQHLFFFMFSAHLLPTLLLNDI